MESDLTSDAAIGWILAALFVFVTLVFVVIAVLFPEWVGITGKKAQEYMRDQHGDLDSAQKSPQELQSSSPAGTHIRPKDKPDTN